MTNTFMPAQKSDEELKELQLQGLKWTVDHAHEGSEFYRARLDEANVTAQDIRSLDDLKHLPFTTSKDLQEGCPFPLLSVPMEALTNYFDFRDLACDGWNDIDGLEVLPKNSMAIKRMIGYLPDKFGVYEQMSVWEYLDFFCAAYRIPRKLRRKRVEEVLELTEAGYMLDYQVGSLSHGMTKRVGLARTLLHDPEVVILDEPANGLDPIGRIEMRRMILRLKDHGKTIMLSSHILPELSSICDRVGIIEKGRLVCQGTVKEITASLQEEMNISIMVVGKAERAAEICQAFPNVRTVTSEGNELRVIFDGTRDQVAELNRKLANSDVAVIGLSEEEADLEQVFLKVTGKNEAPKPAAATAPAKAAGVEKTDR